MPRYYFHLCDDDILWDEEGAELPNAEAALKRAFEIARDIAGWNVRDGHLTRSHQIKIAGPSGEDIGVIAFDEAVQIKS